MNPILSIIVPVYNVEKYLEECINSILNQSFKDFELILVNDGSKDSSGFICDSYAEKDSRIIVLHRSNQGTSAAKNTGIDIARGDYIAFVDSDDFVSEDYYQPNISYLLNHPETDMIVMQVCRFDGDKNLIIKNKKTKYSNNHDAVGYLFSMDYICSPWINIYKKKVFENLRYPVGKIFEDGYVMPDVASKINNLVLSEEGVYYYRETIGSIMQRRRTEHYWIDVLDCHIRMLDYIYGYPGNELVFLSRYKSVSLALIYAFIEFPNGDFGKYIKLFESYKFNLIQILKVSSSLKEFIRLNIQNNFGFTSLVKVYKFFKLY